MFQLITELLRHCVSLVQNYVDTISVICNKHRGHRQRNTEPHGLRQLSRKFKDIVSVKFIPTRKFVFQNNTEPSGHFVSLVQNYMDIVSA